MRQCRFGGATTTEHGTLNGWRLQVVAGDKDAIVLHRSMQIKWACSNGKGALDE